MRIIEEIKDKLFEWKMKKQRAEKGYCDLDVWNVDMFIERTLLNILIEFRKKHNSFPPDTNEEEWNNTLDRMIFLLGQMNEDYWNIQSDYPNLEQIKSKRKAMEKAKDEFYDLLKKYHWLLWY